MKTVKLPSIQSNSQRFPSLQDEVNYGRQRGVRYGRLRIMKDRVIANNGTVDSIMLDADGLHAYNNSSQEIITVNYLGLHAYTIGAVEMVRVDATGFHGYNAAGNELVRVDNTGTHYYDTSGNELIKVDSTGFHGYNTTPTEILTLNTSGLTLASGDDKIMMVMESSVGYIDFYAGGARKARIRGNTAVSGGAQLTTGDLAIANNFSFLAKGTGSNYGSFGVTNSNQLWITTTDNDALYFFDGASHQMAALSYSDSTSLANFYIPTGHVQLAEISEPSNPSTANTGLIFMKDNGAGKTQLCVRFASGASQVIATEP